MDKINFLNYCSSVENIIFDLGGVLFNLDSQLTINKFSKICKSDHIKEGENILNCFDVFKSFEKGEVSSAHFRNEVREILNASQMTDYDFDDAWNSMILDFPLERFDFLRELSKSKNLYLLSNINDIHETFVNNCLNKILENKNKFYKLFKKIYFSHKVHLRKPESEIFELVCNENNLNMKKTLFVDDTMEHINSANKLGLKTLHLNPPNSLVSIINCK